MGYMTEHKDWRVQKLKESLHFPHCYFETTMFWDGSFLGDEFKNSKVIRILLIDEDTGFTVGRYFYDCGSYREPIGYTSDSTEREVAFIRGSVLKAFGIKRKNPFNPESMKDDTPASNKFLQGFVYWCLEKNKKNKTTTLTT